MVLLGSIDTHEDHHSLLLLVSASPISEDGAVDEWSSTRLARHPSSRLASSPIGRGHALG